MEHEKYSQRLSLLPIDNQVNLELSNQILKADLNKLIPYVLDRAISCDQNGVKTVLTGLYMVHNDLAGIYDDLLAPVLHRIGEMWMDGNLSVTEEHLASQTIRDGIIKLQDVIVKPDVNLGRVLVLTLSEELHDIPAKMVHHVLESRGFQVLFSGQKTPAGDTARVFQTFHPDRVYLSFIYTENPEKAQVEFDELVELCKAYDAKLFVGGAGLAQLNVDEGVDLQRLNSFREILEA